MWEAFDPEGRANVRAELHRPAGVGRNAKPFDMNVVADLLGISACYERLPLPMTDVQGQIQITPDEFVVANVAAAIAMRSGRLMEW